MGGRGAPGVGGLSGSPSPVEQRQREIETQAEALESALLPSISQTDGGVGHPAGPRDGEFGLRGVQIPGRGLQVRSLEQTRPARLPESLGAAVPPAPRTVRPSSIPVPRERSARPSACARRGPGVRPPPHPARRAPVPVATAASRRRRCPPLLQADLCVLGHLPDHLRGLPRGAFRRFREPRERPGLANLEGEPGRVAAVTGCARFNRVGRRPVSGPRFGPATPGVERRVDSPPSTRRRCGRGRRAGPRATG